jgi:hypothetical protein
MKDDRLESLAKLLAKSWFYGDWKWESPNERAMQMIMQDLGLYPFNDEDEMIRKTQVDDELYKQSIKEVSTRSVSYKSSTEEPISEKIDESSKEDDIKDWAYLTSVSKGLDGSVYQETYLEAFIDGYNKSRETLYTVEQVRAAMKYASEVTNNKMKYMEDYIQSIKHPKK